MKFYQLLPKNYFNQLSKAELAKEMTLETVPYFMCNHCKWPLLNGLTNAFSCKMMIPENGPPITFTQILFQGTLNQNFNQDFLYYLSRVSSKIVEVIVGASLTQVL